MLKLSVVFAAAVLLVGCAGQPLTPQQQSMMLQIMQNQQAQQQNNYNQQMANLRAAQQANQQNAPVNCTTSYVSGTAYTHCQ
jgi:hypothetical protein